jgi:rubrerythrin
MEPGTANGAAPLKDATARAAAAAQPEAAEKAAAEGRLYYVCPMPGHGDILYDTPSKCPLCGMTLVPVRRHAGHVESPHIAYWTCPMPEHSSIHKPGPGKCPLCSMSLIPVPEAQAENESPAPPHPHAADTE